MTAVALSCLLLLAGCSSAGTDPESSDPAAPASSAAGKGASSAAPSTPGEGDRGDVRLGEVDLKKFSYRGGCGFEVPAEPVTLRDGKQSEKTPGFGGLRSEAELTGSQQVTIDGRDYVLARFSCEVGDQKLVAAHLIGSVDGEPEDLGIVATGSKITADGDDDQLAFETSYRTVEDGDDEATGKTSYKIEMIGNTPVRIFGGEDGSKIDPAVKQLPAHGYDAGLVGIEGYLDDADEATWLVGMLDKPGQVLSSDTIGGGYEGECLTLSVHTQAGEKLDGGLRSFPDDDAATGTALDVKPESEAEPGERSDLSLPVKNQQAGLLIPVNGVVPALATVTTRTSDDQLKSPLVITRAPADAWLDIWRFGAASGSEYPLPIGAFATPDGKIAMTGAWYKAPIDEAGAAFGMRPLVAPEAMGEKTCG
ncbi:hypothetical protein SAMN04489812_1705 [Microlunatus soli]|uniref:Uncharacterized protein n=2 Tax=Microlunatus soli TaxID=630515 RepID=A0A1H1RMW4_9ACTN|nr:hypothetical protein SAMN04489812_1705 [Microlunatus soli]